MKKQIAFILSFASALCLGGCHTDNASIGIIGGADGPTAILIVSNLSWMRVCGLIGVIAVVILIARIISRKKK